MRKVFASLCTVALVVSLAGAQGSKQTPAPEDTPTPVAGDIGLAGAPCPDIARYLNVRSAVAPSLSPDGSRVAYRTRVTGTPQVWVAEVGGRRPPRQMTFGESVTFHEWSPDGRWIAYGVDRGGNEREGFYLLSPWENREIELLPPSESFRAWGGFTRDDREVAFAATEPGGEDFSVYTVNLTAEPLRPQRVYTGKGGVYFAAWRPDAGGMLLTRTRGEDANDVLYLDRRTGKAETLFEPQVAARYESFEWTPDGRGFYLATDQDRDFSGLAFYDFERRQLRWVETPEHDVEEVTLSEDGRWLAWTQNVNGFSEIRLRDLRTGRTGSFVVEELSDETEPPAERAQPAGRNRTPARRGRAAAPRQSGAAVRRTREMRGVVNSLAWAAKGPHLAVQISAPNLPGDIWVLHAAGVEILDGRVVPVEAVGPTLPAPTRFLHMLYDRVTESSLAGLDPSAFVAPEAVSFPSHDGVTIHGLLYTPKGANAARRAPVVLSVHGGPTAQARPDFDEVLQYLIARGYAVLDLNVRGSTGYGKRFARLDNGRLRPNAVKDMGAAVEWLGRSNRPVDARRVAVMGGSYGGYMTLAALTQLPEKFRAGVNFVGVSNWVTALEGASPQLKASDRIEYGNIDDPGDREFFKQLSPLTHVANVRAPL
ncbi:MAG TPA: prolyl oligopeptidase family serine peptidase, partial [Pyrinomonadaceae bacterium]|nr:prolyl oligopeptidase family serine peptidase [Pyrinomonadaceae bacterium]